MSEMVSVYLIAPPREECHTWLNDASVILMESGATIKKEKSDNSNNNSLFSYNSIKVKLLEIHFIQGELSLNIVNITENFLFLKVQHDRCK